MTLFEWEIEQYAELAAARRSNSNTHAIFRTLDNKSVLQISVFAECLRQMGTKCWTCF